MRAALPLLALLAGCGAVTVHQARTDLLGMTAPDLLACAGVPDRVQALSRDELLLQYDYKPAAGSLFSLTLPLVGSLAVGAHGACEAHFRVLRDGTVSGVSYSGTSFSFSGPSADCVPLVRECVEHPDRTGLPAGYDAFAILLPKGP